MPGPFWVLVNGVLQFTGTMSVTTALFGNGAVGSPSMSFLSDPDTGFFRLSANAVGLATGGGLLWSGAANFVLNTGASLGFDSASGTGDVFIVRDAANVLAQRNATSPQGLRIYNTFTSLTDYERLEIGSSVAGQAANTFAIIPTAGTSGTLRNLVIGSSIGLTVLNSSRVNVIGKLDFTVAASTFAQTATITNGPRAANPVNWVEVSYNGGTTGRIPIW